MDIGNWGKNPNITPGENYHPAKEKLRPCIGETPVNPCTYYHLHLADTPFRKEEYHLRNKCSHGDSVACHTQATLYLKISEQIKVNLIKEAMKYFEFSCFHGLIYGCTDGAHLPEKMGIPIKKENMTIWDSALNLGMLVCEKEPNHRDCKKFVDNILKSCTESLFTFDPRCEKYGNKKEN